MKKFDFVVLLLLCTMLCSCGIKKPLEPPTDDNDVIARKL
ncbi:MULTISPECIES: LPS translocon maturation chaperone LptM [unclassified Rickettsia]